MPFQPGQSGNPLGHLPETWTNDAAFKAHLTGGIRWALGLEN